MLVLYESSNSVCCQKVRLVLCEKGLPGSRARSTCFAASSTILITLRSIQKG